MITILTPTYNRAYILTELYKSLKKQTSKEFEWIVIDDGSVDNTNEIVEKWIDSDSDFSIRYYLKKNGGKHTALNYGIRLSNFQYVYIIDSDDHLTYDAVEKINRWIKTIDSDKSFAGVSGLRAYPNNKGIIGQFPKEKDYVDATNLERKSKKLLGDKAEIYRKDILLKYPFPEFEGERFIPEASVWDRIAAEGYKLRWFKDVICICEYLDDGLTKNNNINVILNNFKGYSYIEKLNYENRKFPHNYLAVARYIEVSRIKNIENTEIKNNLEISNSKLILGNIFRIIRKTLKAFVKK
ncbi:glycosyltransferase family 2 protein [Streptococcus suis]